MRTCSSVVLLCCCDCELCLNFGDEISLRRVDCNTPKFRKLISGNFRNQAIKTWIIKLVKLGVGVFYCCHIVIIRILYVLGNSS
jgi:hypothetical protein